MTVKAKFRVSKVTRHAHGFDEVVLEPHYEDSGPNKSWSEATPSGKIEMTITNQTAVDYFEAGVEYLIDFERVEPVPVDSAE